MAIQHLEVRENLMKKPYWREFGVVSIQSKIFITESIFFIKLNYFFFLLRYMKPLLTHSRPTLLETLPVCCSGIARLLTTTEQLTQVSFNFFFLNSFNYLFESINHK